MALFYHAAWGSSDSYSLVAVTPVRFSHLPSVERMGFPQQYCALTPHLVIRDASAPGIPTGGLSHQAIKTQDVGRIALILNQCSLPKAQV